MTLAIVNALPTRSLAVATGYMNRLLDVLEYIPSKNDIFIKPNMVDAVPVTEAIDTDPVLIGGLLLALAGRGSYRFVVGDGSGYFSSSERTWKRLVDKSGYEKMIKQVRSTGVEVELVNLEPVDRLKVEWAHSTLEVPALCKTHSYINFAKMKTHVHTMVSLAVKNQKGLLLLADKKAFHAAGEPGTLHERIKALGKAIHPELSIIDGTRALEGSGPSTAPAGQTAVRRPGVIIGGKNMIEVDNAACRFMGIPVKEVRHLDETIISIAEGSSPLMPANPPFKSPSLRVLMSDKVARVAYDTCCTGCQMALSRVFRKIAFTPALRERFVSWQDGIEGATILLGRPDRTGETSDLMTNEGGTMIHFGACTRHASIEHGGLHVPGCPPDHNDAIELLLSKNEKT